MSRFDPLNQRMPPNTTSLLFLLYVSWIPNLTSTFRSGFSVLSCKLPFILIGRRPNGFCGTYREPALIVCFILLLLTSPSDFIGGVTLIGMVIQIAIALPLDMFFPLALIPSLGLANDNPQSPSLPLKLSIERLVVLPVRLFGFIGFFMTLVSNKWHLLRFFVTIKVVLPLLGTLSSMHVPSTSRSSITLFVKES